MKNLSIKKQVEIGMNEGLKKKGIPNFFEMGLKEINHSVKNVRSHIENNIFKKAGRNLLKDCSLEELEDHFNADEKGRYKVMIKNLDDQEVYEGDYKRELMRTVNQDNEVVNLEIIIADSYNDLSFTSRVLTSKDFKVKSKGLVSLRRKGTYYQVEELEKVIGIIFVVNELIKFRENKSNLNMFYLHMYNKMIRENKVAFVRSEEDRRTILNLYDEIDIDASELVRLDSLFNSYGKILSTEEDFLNLKELYTAYDRLDEDTMKECVAFVVRAFSYGSFAEIYDFVISMNKEEEIRVKNRVSTNSDYARSFETKKNIPEFIQEKMKDNCFIKYFDFVELDELVDLEKFDLIENDWVNFMNKVNFPISENHSLRFRRLGNHKAGGLYFPNANAVCVDLDNSSSLIHELFHMLDYSKEGLNYSEEFEFRFIYEEYKNLLEREVENLDEEDSTKKDWNGKKKYNKDYYLTTEEVFARCGEIYIRRVLGIESYLVKGEGFFYPEGEKLEKMIKKYFNKVFA